MPGNINDSVDPAGAEENGQPAQSGGSIPEPPAERPFRDRFPDPRTLPNHKKKTTLPPLGNGQKYYYSSMLEQSPTMHDYVLPHPPPPPPSLVQPPVTITPITPPPSVGGPSGPNGTSKAPIIPVASPPQLVFDPLAALTALNTWYSSLPLAAQLIIGGSLIGIVALASFLIFPEEIAALASLACFTTWAAPAFSTAVTAVSTFGAGVWNELPQLPFVGGSLSMSCWC
jgi:hypothetical protein